MPEIHPTAIVDPKAELAADVRVGPMCFIDAGVRLGPGCELYPHVTLLGPSTFGAGNTFYPYCVLGAAPQDLKYKGGPTELVVGDHNQFREHVTIHRGTEVDTVSQGVTRIGSRNLFMVGVHVGHDADICNNVIFANYVQMAGHVRVEDCANIGGVAAMHHFVTIGRYAFVGGMTHVSHDVPPFMKVFGFDQRVRGVNTPGLQRWGFPEGSIRNLRKAAKLLYFRRDDSTALQTSAALDQIEADGLIEDANVRYLVEYVRRKLEFGVFGRAREHFRTDTDADRAGFYAARAPEGDR